MRDEGDRYFGVLAANALKGEEEERLRELPFGFAHAAGHVEREDHGCVRCGPLTANKLPETQVVIDERGRVLLNRTPPDRLFHGASAVQARTYAALVPALAHEFDVVLPRGLLWFEIGQLQLFPQ